MAAPNIVLFHYPHSPYARRITWYLALRGIEYSECIQPALMPRPDLEKLGIHYRRIPLLSIGRSVYCDTRLILGKLESLFPSHPSLSVSEDPTKLATQQLLESWTVDGGIFVRSSQLLPLNLPLMKDPAFLKDREDFSGRPWNPDAVEAIRPEALSHLRQAFDFLEYGLLADGRDWILATEQPSLADINAIWPFHWLIGLRTALPENLISAKTNPKVFAYVQRFDQAVKAARAESPKVRRLSGQDAIDLILQAQYPDAENEMGIDRLDPIGSGLHLGQLVESWPIDSGFRHKDIGKLVKLSKEEVVLELNGEGQVRLHHPRWNFRVKAVEEGSKL